MNHLLLYIYRIHRVDREEFLEVMRRVRWIYRGHGGAGEELFLLSDDTPKYGLTGLWEVTPPVEGEEVWVGLDRYEDAAHCERVMKAVNAEPAIDALYERIVGLVGSAERIVRGEFEQVEY